MREDRAGRRAVRGDVHQRRCLALPALLQHPGSRAWLPAAAAAVALTAEQQVANLASLGLVHRDVLHWGVRRRRRGARAQLVDGVDAEVRPRAEEVLPGHHRPPDEERVGVLRGRRERQLAEVPPALRRPAVHGAVDEEHGVDQPRVGEQHLADMVNS